MFLSGQWILTDLVAAPVIEQLGADNDDDEVVKLQKFTNFSSLLLQSPTPRSRPARHMTQRGVSRTHLGIQIIHHDNNINFREPVLNRVSMLIENILLPNTGNLRAHVILSNLN